MATSHFDWADPFLLDDQLSEDERMIRDTARLCAGQAGAADHRRLRARDHRSRHLP